MWRGRGEGECGLGASCLCSISILISGLRLFVAAKRSCSAMKPAVFGLALAAQAVATWDSESLLSILKMFAELLLNNNCQATVVGVLLSEDRFMAAAFKFCVFYSSLSDRGPALNSHSL